MFRHRCPRAGTEDLLYLIAIEGNHVLQHEAGHQLNLKAVAEQPCERPRDADPMMDRARYTQGPVKGKYPARRLLVTGDTIAARSVPEPRGVSEKAGRHSPRHSPALEIIEAEFLLAIGQNVERYPLPQLGGKFGLLDHSSKRSAAMAAIDFCHLGDNLGRDLMLASNGLDFLRNRRQGKSDHSLTDRDFRWSQAADFEEAHQGPHGRRRYQKCEQHKTGRENADELTNLGRQRGVLGCGERQCEGNRAAHASP